jgi:hypothetical protein
MFEFFRSVEERQQTYANASEPEERAHSFNGAAGSDYANASQDSEKPASESNPGG